MTARYCLEALNITKTFGDFTALDNVSFRLKPGSFHALLGENGAGKSTLVKCMMGFYQPNSGSIIFGDKEQAIKNPTEASAMGLGMVYQHFTLIPNMTVAENIIMARPKLPFVINWREEIEKISRKMATMPFHVDLNKSVNDLAAGEKQKVEIIKQLMLDTRVLILDEPTSVLTPKEADEVLNQIKQLTQTHELSVVLITHKFKEVMSFCDEVTVLRKGQWITTTEVASTDPQKLADLMIGSQYQQEKFTRTQMDDAPTMLGINNIHVLNNQGKVAVNGLKLSVNAGEIVGIAGVSGNGQLELVEALTGLKEIESGNIEVNSLPFAPTRKQIEKQRIYTLPEEPLKNACVPDMTVAENIALRRFDHNDLTRGKWFISNKRIRQYARRLIERYRVKTPSPNAQIKNLSGGNVQRAVLSRELEQDAKVLIVANPVFGLDFGAVSDIHHQLIEARNRGVAILLISEDLDEVLELSDRICVISDGSIVYETTPDNVNLNEIGQYMAGH